MNKTIEYTTVFNIDGTLVVADNIKEATDIYLEKHSTCAIQKIEVVSFNMECICKSKQPQVRTGIEWANTIDDACNKQYAEEYAHGEYCHEQSFKWGFQEGVEWFEKQGQESKKVSIWKHWKNGIAGNGEDKPSYLIKCGDTYHLSSCLSLECDYIELSELDNLMLEKQYDCPAYNEKHNGMQIIKNV